MWPLNDLSLLDCVRIGAGAGPRPFAMPGSVPKLVFKSVAEMVVPYWAVGRTKAKGSSRPTVCRQQPSNGARPATPRAAPVQKPAVSSDAADPQVAAGVLPAGENGLSYAVCWKAADAPLDAPRALPSPSTPSSHTLAIVNTLGGAGSLAATVAVMQQGQQAVSLPSAPPLLAVSMYTTGAVALGAPALTSQLRSSASGACAAARCWAQEGHSVQVSVMDYAVAELPATSAANPAVAVPLSFTITSGPLAGRDDHGNGLYGSSLAGNVLHHACLTSQVAPVADVTTASRAAAVPVPCGGMCHYGTFIVTGGSGMVAGHVALWLARSAGAGHVHLVRRAQRARPWHWCSI